MLSPLRPEEALHIIVDVQYDFNDEPGSLTSYARSFPKTDRIIRRVLPDALKGSPVLVTFDTHPPAEGSPARQAYRQMLAETLGEDRVERFMQRADEIYAEERKIYPVHCEYGSAGWELTGGIAALVRVLHALEANLYLLQKPSYDLTTGCIFRGAPDQLGKGGLELLKSLRDQGVKRAYVHGLITPVCVKAAARACRELGFEVVVYEQTVESYSEETHRAGLAEIEALGATVVYG